MSHGKRLGLESVPWSTTSHRVVGNVTDGVDGFAANDFGWLMRKGVKEETLEGGEGLYGEMVVESHGTAFSCLRGGRAEEESAKEN